MTLDEAKVAWKVLHFLFVAGYEHASEGLRAIEGWVHVHYPREDVGAWPR